MSLRCLSHPSTSRVIVTSPEPHRSDRQPSRSFCAEEVSTSALPLPAHSRDHAMSAADTSEAPSAQRLCASLHGLASSLPDASDVAVPLLAALTPASIAPLCTAPELSALVRCLQLLDARHVQPQPRCCEAQTDAPPAPPSALLAARASVSHLSSAVEQLHGRQRSLRQRIAEQQRRLDAASRSLAAVQAALDSSALACNDCLPRLLPDSDDEWDAALLSSYAAEDDAVDMALQRWLSEEAEEWRSWREQAEGAEDAQQVELSRLREALHTAQRCSVHARLECAAARARLDALEQQRLPGDEPITGDDGPPSEEDDAHQQSATPQTLDRCRTRAVRRCTDSLRPSACAAVLWTAGRSSPLSWSWPRFSALCTRPSPPTRWMSSPAL